jgi:dihydroorotate dehydrogenase (NAD+) catalytic subunit
MVNLTQKISTLTLKTPIILASGTVTPEIKKYTSLSKIGALTTKSITLKPKKGNLPPRTTEVVGGMLNSIGMENPGVVRFIEEELNKWLTLKVPIIVSVGGKEVEEYLKVIEKLNSIPVSAYELNVSCPNVKGREISKSPKELEKLIKETKKITHKPVIVKLSPNVSDIQEIGIAAINSGVDGFSLINTVYGMKVDINEKKPMLGNITGGLSGPCIKPIALYYVYKLRQITSLPIIGGGGIMNYKDALEFFMVGANCVSIGTANFINPNIGNEIVEKIIHYCNTQKIKNISELVGIIKEK